MRNIIRKISNSKVAVVAGLVAVSFSNVAFAVAPLDLATTATTVAGYVGTAMTAGLVIFSAIYGGRLMIRAFKAIGK